jgi:tRNA(Ile)-lysidine synthase
MLVALASLASSSTPHSPHLYCLHVEHGIRPPQESKGDAEYVKGLCKKLDVPCRVVSVPSGRIARVARQKGIGIEAAARQYRMRALNREARRLEASGDTVRVLTAHTRDDFLETVLMRIFRGAGPAGLAAIPKSRGRFLRPLFHLSRGDVIAYLRKKNIPWREDSTNKDAHFLRNKIRLQLVPALNEMFPCLPADGWQSALSALAETQSLAADFIKEEAERRVSWQALNSDALYTPAEAFFSQPPIIREEALFQGADRLLAKKSQDGAPLKRANVRRFCSGEQKASDLGKLSVRRTSVHCVEGRLILEKAKTRPSERGFALFIKGPGSYKLKSVSVEVKPGIREGEGNCFFTQVPIVFRPAYKGDFLVRDGKKIKAPRPQGLISAVSPQGIAAFIDKEGHVLSRDALKPDPQECYTVLVCNISANTGQGLMKE